MAEIQSGPPEDPLRQALSSCDWMLTVRLDSPLPVDPGPRLGTGEAAVLEYARTRGKLPVLLDDRQARRRAESLGLKTYGTLGLIAMATTRGHIESFSSAVQQLRERGCTLVTTSLILSVRRLGRMVHMSVPRSAFQRSIDRSSVLLTSPNPKGRGGACNTTPDSSAWFPAGSAQIL